MSLEPIALVHELPVYDGAWGGKELPHSEERNFSIPLQRLWTSEFEMSVFIAQNRTVMLSALAVPSKLFLCMEWNFLSPGASNSYDKSANSGTGWRMFLVPGSGI
jgi:hypothetical protein